MKYGVFSDVHGNYEALLAVLDFFTAQNTQAHICCGDLTGYGPQSEECIKATAALPNLNCVIGNHDMAVLGRMPVEAFNHYAASAIEIIQPTLSPESIHFLAHCPQLVADDGITIVHGSPRSPIDEYLLTVEQFLENSGRWQTDICFIGHTHVPVCFRRKGRAFPLMLPLRENEPVTIAREEKMMINPGSVGQPRDGDNRASCGLYDSDTKTFELFRLSYDVAKTQKLMKAMHFPDLLIERIEKGW